MRGKKQNHRVIISIFPTSFFVEQRTFLVPFFGQKKRNMPKEALFHFRGGKTKGGGRTKKPFSHNAIVNKHQEKKKKKMNAHEKKSVVPISDTYFGSPPPFFLVFIPKGARESSRRVLSCFPISKEVKKSP